MFYREIIAVCSEIHTKHIHTVCVRNMGEWGRALCILRLDIFCIEASTQIQALTALSLWQEPPFPIG
jgi:hypothetical protein